MPAARASRRMRAPNSSWPTTVISATGTPSFARLRAMLQPTPPTASETCPGLEVPSTIASLAWHLKSMLAPPTTMTRPSGFRTWPRPRISPCCRSAERCTDTAAALVFSRRAMAATDSIGSSRSRARIWRSRSVMGLDFIRKLWKYKSQGIPPSFRGRASWAKRKERLLPAALWSPRDCAESVLVAEERAVIVAAVGRLLRRLFRQRLGRVQRVEVDRLAGRLARFQDRGVEVGLGAQAEQHRI